MVAAALPVPLASGVELQQPPVSFYYESTDLTNPKGSSVCSTDLGILSSWLELYYMTVSSCRGGKASIWYTLRWETAQEQ